MSDAAAGGRDRITLRVLTYNVWGYNGEPSRQARLRQHIASLDPDLIAFQEVVKTPDQDQTTELVADTDLSSIHQLDLPGFQMGELGEWQTGLASRWRPTNAQAIRLPDHDSYATAMAAVIPLPIGEDLLFMVVKPAWRFDQEAARCRQAVAITDLERRLRRQAPTIIAGDFDATPDADCMRYYTGKTPIDGHSVHFLDCWALAGAGGTGHTWTTTNPGLADFVDKGLVEPTHARRIDYILVGSPFAHDRVPARVRSCRVVSSDPPASDHHAVLAEIDIRVLGPESV